MHSIISLFSGAGGLDLGFHNARFKTIYANEYDKNIIPTFKYNFKDTELNTDDIRLINPKTIPDALGIIGGPPCQIWSIAGNLKGINDPRGILFFDYINILAEKKPYFFVIENVPGILNTKNTTAFEIS